jgi:hypothetical protein
MSCAYANIFGEPGKGVHSLRIANVAIVDFVLTIVASFVIAKYWKKNFWIVFFILLLTGMFLHWLFCVRTSFSF